MCVYTELKSVYSEVDMPTNSTVTNNILALNSSVDLDNAPSLQTLRPQDRAYLKQLIGTVYPCAILQFTGGGTYLSDLVRNGLSTERLWNGVKDYFFKREGLFGKIIALQDLEGVTAKERITLFKEYTRHEFTDTSRRVYDVYNSKVVTPGYRVFVLSKGY